MNTVSSSPPSNIITHSMFSLYIKIYIQIAIDVGSSTVARGVVNLVLGYLTNLVIEMAFLVQVSSLISTYIELNYNEIHA